MKNILTADDSNFAQQVDHGDEPVLVDFWAPWCGPCRMQGPILESYASMRPEQRIVKVNVDQAQGVAMRYGIRSIPTLGVFKKGQMVVQGIGVHDEEGLDRLIAAARAA